MSSFIFDNFANSHIFSEEDMFTDKIEPRISNVVATIGRKCFIPKGIRIVSWSYIDDEVQLNTNKLNNIIYFIGSPVNIVRKDALDESIKDVEWTWVLTKRKSSIFSWGFGNYK